MANCFALRVLTAEGTVLEGQAEYCNLPTDTGSVGILANHAPMLCAIREGKARFRMEDGTEKTVALSPGAADIRDNSVTVIADRASIQA